VNDADIGLDQTHIESTAVGLAYLARVHPIALGVLYRGPAQACVEGPRLAREQRQLRCKYRQLGDMPPGSNVSIAQSSAHAFPQ